MRRPRPVRDADRPPCAPAGDLRPWADDRPRSCTWCAEFVDVVASSDGTDWHALDGAGQSWARHPLPELCRCVAPLLGGCEPRRWFGHGIPDDGVLRAPGHVHNALGGQVFYTEIPHPLGPCGWRMPPQRRSLPIEPVVTDRAPPECCGWPMRWAPRGWQCRLSGAYFVPAFPVRTLDTLPRRVAS